jgi:hypothetical protein
MKLLYFTREGKAMNNVVFLEAPEIKSIAEKLKERYYVYIGYVDLEQIYFAEMVGHTPKKAKPVVVNGLAQKWVRDLLLGDVQDKKIYCLGVYEEKWAELTKAHKEWALFAALYSISPQNDGSIRQFEVQDYAFILEYFIKNNYGANYMNHSILPSLLDSKDPLAIPLPPDPEDN